MATPTQFEIESARAREELAAEERRGLDLAIAECGPGAKRYACWVIRDKTERIPEQRIYCCQRDGVTGWQPGHATSNERLTETDHPGYEINGERLFPFRFSIGLHTLNLYKPKSAEQLAEAREKRVSKKREKLRKSILKQQRESLFPEMYDPELQEIE
ncbi:hypothetical protein V6x_28270 [Gimesia chilikensis]|uniref:Uncharacterized protein n=1 Tax=Gimesia chilikensis TaxID=2605989 RepID=A0A517WCZ0_9PLAN|nr:hypothetical protein [Gimesia chilikensis]QDU03115.1 hypothetical protein V6x_28270 [Gimesia chilikensis]